MWGDAGRQEERQTFRGRVESSRPRVDDAETRWGMSCREGRKDPSGGGNSRDNPMSRKCRRSRRCTCRARGRSWAARRRASRPESRRASARWRSSTGRGPRGSCTRGNTSRGVLRRRRRAASRLRGRSPRPASLEGAAAGFGRSPAEASEASWETHEAAPRRLVAGEGILRLQPHETRDQGYCPPCCRLARRKSSLLPERTRSITSSPAASRRSPSARRRSRAPPLTVDLPHSRSRSFGRRPDSQFSSPADMTHAPFIQFSSASRTVSRSAPL